MNLNIKSSESEENLIEVQNVTKRFKNTIAVNNLSLQIRKGEFVALLGPNGTGKTTLIEMLEGIQKTGLRIHIDSWNHLEKKRNLSSIQSGFSSSGNQVYGSDYGSRNSESFRNFL